MNTETPDWPAWLAEHEERVWGDDEPPPPVRPDRGWRRLGDIACEILAGVAGGTIGLIALGCLVYAARVIVS